MGADMNARLKHRSAATTAAPLPGKIARLLRESKWFALIALALFLTLILFSYRPDDPGWSHSTANLPVHNAGGVVGAWLADLLLYLLGISAWWFVVLCVYAVVWGYRRLDGSSISDRRPFFIALTGFGITLLGSSALEALRFYSLQATLPLAPGGMFGVPGPDPRPHAIFECGDDLRCDARVDVLLGRLIVLSVVVDDARFHAGLLFRS